jgi:hypothetical protein
MWRYGDVVMYRKQHFSVGLCTYVNLCIYVSKNQRSIVRYSDIVMWRYCEIAKYRKQHFSVGLCYLC